MKVRGTAIFFFGAKKPGVWGYARLQEAKSCLIPYRNWRDGALISWLRSHTWAIFRPGSITATQGRCGNPNCHCHKPGEPGHGPTVRLTYKVDGKTITESFATPAAQRKAEREVAEFARYRELSRALIDVNAQVCRARPVEEALSPEEKKRRTPSNRKSRAK